MRRLAALLTMSAMAAGTLVGISTQPAYALAQCTMSSHRHWHAAHNIWHTWYWTHTTRNSAGRPVYHAWMPEHDERDSATC